MSASNYDILGIKYGASKDEVKQAFRTLTKQYHPDKPTGDAERYKLITRAYSELIDNAPEKKPETGDVPRNQTYTYRGRSATAAMEEMLRQWEQENQKFAKQGRYKKYLYILKQLEESMKTFGDEDVRICVEGLIIQIKKTYKI